MSNANGASATPLSIFSPAEREKLLKLTVGKRTGVLVEIGGVTIDLLPFSAAEGLSVFAFVRLFADVSATINAGTFTQTDFAALIGDNGPAILALLRLYLARCIGLRLEPRDATIPAQAIELEDLALAEQPERESYELWFSQLELFDTVRKIFPHFMEANGMIAITRPPEPAPSEISSGAAEAATPATASTPSTSSG